MKKTFKNLFAIIIALVLFIPVSVFAATEIGLEDFEDAYNNSGEYTEKGLKYVSYYGPDDEEPEGEFAEGYYAFDTGEYKLTQDIGLGYNAIFLVEVDVTLDLNGHTISTDFEEAWIPVIHSEESNLIIKGNGTLSGNEALDVFGGSLVIQNGTINGYAEFEAGDFTINDATFNNGLDVYGKYDYDKEDYTGFSTLNIKNGTFNDIIWIIHSNATIDDGKFLVSSGVAVSASYLSTITINGGTFESGYTQPVLSGDAAWVYDEQSSSYIPDEGTSPKYIINGGSFEAKSGPCAIELHSSSYNYNIEPEFEINAGTFMGLEAGLCVFNPNSSITLKGGVFTSTDESFTYRGGIHVAYKDESLFYDLLAEGYGYTEDLKTTYDPDYIREDGAKQLFSQNNISVEHLKYQVVDGNNQTFDASGAKELVFRFSIPFAEFKASGKVYLDDKEVDPKNYTAAEGSTIITFTKEFAKANIHDGNHTVKVVTDLGEVTASFKAINNPATVDNVMILAGILSIAVAGTLITCLKYKKREN